MWALLSFYPYVNERSRSDAMTEAREDCERRRKEGGNALRFRWVHREIGDKAGYAVEEAR